MCDLCGHEEAVPGHLLCTVCLEAMIRLSAAVAGLEKKVEPEPVKPAAIGAFDWDDYRTAHLGPTGK